MKYKLVIFDFDGTLADSFSFFVAVLNRLANQYNFRRIESNEIEALRSYDAGQMMKHVGLPAWKLPMVANSFRILMKKNINLISLFEDVNGLLGLLAHKGIVLAIVSSNSQRNVRQVLGPENAALIKHYECGASIFGKQAKLKKVLRKSGVSCGEAIYIGDQGTDIEAAHRENIASGAVSWGYGEIESLKGHSPKEVFASINEIAEKIA